MQSENATPTRPNAGHDLQDKIGTVGERLSEVMRGVLGAIPGSPHRPHELARILSISKDLSSRTLMASTKDDPLAVTYLMPGPASLRRLLRAASRKRVPASLIQEAEAAIQQFERLIQFDAGDRISLDGIISSWLPDARERFETGNKQAVFRGMAQLKGVQADVGVTTAIIHPAEDGKNVDGVWMLGSLGLRRIRPGRPINFFSGQVDASLQGKPKLTLGGQPADGLGGLQLKPFCSSPVPEVSIRREGQKMYYTVEGVGTGPAAAIDLFVAERTPNCMRRYNTDADQGLCGPSSLIGTPIATLVFDVLVHEDVFPGEDPILRVYDTALVGVADINDPARDIDCMDVSESVESLGWGTSSFSAPEIPRYTKILTHVFDEVGWDNRKFRGYRCRSQYPVYGSQLSMMFQPQIKD